MDDLISRQASIALADTLKDSLPNDERMADAVISHNEGILEYQTALSLLPSAQLERKRGEWINRSLNIIYPAWERYTCSACGGHSDRYDFCPNCGAEMENAEGEE